VLAALLAVAAFDFLYVPPLHSFAVADTQYLVTLGIMLAAAFLHGPDLLFLDEPFINLDPIYQRRLKDYLLEYSAAGHTVFMCSHLLEIAEKLCDRVAVIDGGRVIAQGSVAEVRKEEKDLESAFLRLVGERR